MVRVTRSQTAKAAGKDTSPTKKVQEVKPKPKPRKKKASPEPRKEVEEEQPEKADDEAMDTVGRNKKK